MAIVELLVTLDGKKGRRRYDGQPDLEGRCSMAPALERKRTSASVFRQLVRGRNHRLSAQTKNLPPQENSTGREERRKTPRPKSKRIKFPPTNGIPPACHRSILLLALSEGGSTSDQTSKSFFLVSFAYSTLTDLT